MTKLEENKIGFLIFAFVFEIQPILCPHTSLWGVLATPNQHLLTLPSSSVGKSPGLHAQVQQFNPTQDTCFFFLHTYTRILDRHSHTRARTRVFWTRTHIHVHARTCVRVYVYVCVYMLVVAYTTTHPHILSGHYLHPHSGQFFYLVWP